jgi:hypothetical protein
MGTISINNEGIESRLDNIESKVSENTSALNLNFSQMFSNMWESLIQLKILNRHQEILSDAVYTREDVEDA